MIVEKQGGPLPVALGMRQTSLGRMEWDERKEKVGGKGRKEGKSGKDGRKKKTHLL